MSGFNTDKANINGGPTDDQIIDATAGDGVMHFSLEGYGSVPVQVEEVRRSTRGYLLRGLFLNNGELVRFEGEYFPDVRKGTMDWSSPVQKGKVDDRL